MSITKSTIEYNAAYYGGGIDHWFGPLSISGSTIAYNSAAFDGGGIWIGDQTALAPVNTTIANNTPNNCSSQTTTAAVIGCTN